VGHVSDLTQRTIRDKLARLNQVRTRSVCLSCLQALVMQAGLIVVSCSCSRSQMALVLGLEGVDELRDFWGGESAITWRLSATEVKSIMAQRIDLPAGAVAALQLA
jgi:hypothetical protein